MRATKLIFVTGALVALGACGRGATPQSETVTTTNTTTTEVAAAPTPASGAQTFVNTAAASNAFEIASSQLAASNGASAAVKAFAKKMVEAHTGSTAKLKGVAAGLTPPLTPDPTLSAAQQQMLDGLKGQTGQAFDQAYAAAQTTAHQQTLDALRAYATTGDVPALKSFANGLIPTVAAHLNLAKGLK